MTNLTSALSGAPVRNDACRGQELVRLTGITKRFQGATALDGIDFDLRSGEVHVLFGENGAGKSTLINVISGTFLPDAGSYFYADDEIRNLTPAHARAIGICLVFQEFSLVSQLSVEKNLFLGREMTVGRTWLDRQRMRGIALETLRKLKFDIDIDALVGNLSRAQQQMVEIAKALLNEPRVLILDEPTASLTEAETETLFELIGRLKVQGVGIIYVSHRMQEIRRLADRVTVLRDGKKISTVEASQASDDELVTLMTGRRIEHLFPIIEQNPGAVRVAVKNLCLSAGGVTNAELELRSGEIIGVGGLVGSGKSEFVRAIFGLEPILSGSILVDDEVILQPSPAQMLARGICYFPADRVAEGLALQRSIRENASITALDLPSFSNGWFLRESREKAEIGKIAADLKIKPNRIEMGVGNLSGGNRQKVVLARGLARPTSVFLFEEPTVGVDVGAKLEFYQTLKRLAEGGGAVLLVSSDLPELLHLSHRLRIFSRGKMVADLVGQDITEKAALSHFFIRPEGAVQVISGEIE
ncbi:sugar ABC transporter ATP-binding protein [Bradyrhizobium sp. BR13661]|jgi:ribose transport system ATP-binding protein|uniref:sugar ABC transporter ATP-binding protein n=1 Tax=Bradyrhizobium sp. BR13661 TaxID=2940622 RepID=UPI0024761C30|nr:sugar ABC transporter ATP-binding protein [Bradyrhizobium sp. BR13661]MDH6261779.1 ribose transport system ATP-binding protein [Bradyrhizobium sp. BR13661]